MLAAARDPPVVATTLITHIYNESYIMRWFVEHHAGVVDHGIVIDYASTDRSLEIVRKYAPNWEIRQSRNEFFRAAECDAEVMDIERGVSGWKIALNATEFLCGDIKALTESLAIQGYAAAQIKPVSMVDLKERQSADPDVPLDAQCTTGYVGGWITPYKSRLLHCHPDGAYSVGRHSTSHQPVMFHPPGALVKWYGFAPWTDPLRQRKKQIQSRIPADDLALGRGFQHQVDERRLREMWQQECALSGELADNPEYF